MGIERMTTGSLSRFRVIQSEQELARKMADADRPQEAGLNPSLSGALDEVDVLTPEGRESYARLAVLSRQEARRLRQEAQAALRREEAAQQAEEQREREEHAREAARQEDDARPRAAVGPAVAPDGGRDADRAPLAASADANGAEDGEHTPLARLADAGQTASGDTDAQDGPQDSANAADSPRADKAPPSPLHIIV